MYDYIWLNSITHHEPTQLKWRYLHNLGDQSTWTNLMTAHPPPRTDLESRTTSSEKVFVRGRRRVWMRWSHRWRRQRRTCGQGGGIRRQRWRNGQVWISAFACSHPFLKSTDQPVMNFGSLVKRRTANRMKKKEMEPSAKLKHSNAKERREWDTLSWSRPSLISVAPDMKTYTSPHFMRPSFLYSSTIRALALASALARSFFLKHNLCKKKC